MVGMLRSLLVGAVAVCGLFAGKADAETTARPKHGCYKVVGADAVNIREKPFSSSDVVGTASRGDVLVKWRRWCTLRGFWCPVQLGEVRGHSDKRFLEPAPCPPSLSLPAHS